MLDETLTYALIKVVKAHRNQMAARLLPLGLHVGQELLLNQLWRQDGLTQGELIARLGVEPPTVTKTLQRLERAGLVRRSPDPDDSRATVVAATPDGTAALAAWRSEFRETIAPRFADLDDDDWHALTRAAEILAARTSADRTGDIR